MVGNLVADLIKKKESILLDSKVQLGVLLHYEIDTYTDAHPLVAQATRLLHPTQGKYSPVATDLIWDLCLASHWETYSDNEMSQFIQDVYTQLEKASEDFEPRLQEKVAYLIGRDFLTMYSAPDSMQVICEKIHNRTRFKSNLLYLMDDYHYHKDKFDELFLDYFPQLLSQIEGWKSTIVSTI